MCILAQCTFTVSVSIDNRLDKRVNIEHDDREQFSLIFQFLTLFKIFEKAQLLKKGDDGLLFTSRCFLTDMFVHTVVKVIFFSNIQFFRRAHFKRENSNPCRRFRQN